MDKRTTHAAINDVKITSGLLGRVSKLVKEQVLPYQWDILNDVARMPYRTIVLKILVWQKVMTKAIQAIVLQTLRSLQEEKKAIFTEWFFRIVTWLNGWKLFLTD